MFRIRITCASVVCAAVLLAPLLHAATPVVAPEKLRAVALAKKATDTEGKWATKVHVGGTGSANSSSHVVGATDGTTLQLGLLLNSSANYKVGSHDWQNTLKVQHAQTRTPAMESWVKSTDNLELESTYLYGLQALPWVGPFARVKLQTQALHSYEVRPVDTTIKYQDVHGAETASEKVAAETATRTTKAFEPMLLNASVGVFADPVTEKVFALKAKLGAGSQHIIARDGYAVAGYDKDTATVTLKQLETSTQAGAEFELGANGVLNANVSWKAKTRFFYPLYSSSEQKFDGLESLNTDVSASLSVKLAKWASLNYVFLLRRIPLVLDEWQVQHGLLLTTGFDLY